MTAVAFVIVFTVCLFNTCVADVIVNTPLPEQQRLSAVRDNTPLVRGAELDAWRYLFGYLANTPQSSLETQTSGDVSFFELERQAAAYRGRVVTINGRVLRCEQQTSNDDSINFFLCYVRMSDNAEIPLTLCVATLPDNFPVAQRMNETIQVTGVFYKNRYYMVGEDVYSSPTVLANTLQWLPNANEPDTASDTTFRDKYGIWFTLGIALVVWLFIRWRINRRDGGKPPIHFVLPKILFIALSGAYVHAGITSETTIDATFVQSLMNVDVQTWAAMSSSDDAFEESRQAYIELLAKLTNRVPRRYLKSQASQNNVSGIVDEPTSCRGCTFTLRGEAKFVTPIRLTDAECRKLDYNIDDAVDGDSDEYKQTARYKFLYRCEVVGDDVGKVIVYTLQVPQTWKQETAINEPCGFTGIFLQRTVSETNGDTALFVTPRLEWYPTKPPDVFALLASGGMDVSTLDAIPVIRRDDLKRTADGVKPRIDKATLRRALLLTENDGEPFYQMLAAVNKLQPGTLRRYADNELKKSGREYDSVYDLFMRPETQRGRVVKLHGVAKRVVSTPVTDERFGMKVYYQIYLYTDNSQGNPIVICVPNLPDGMRSGADNNYAETVTVNAIFYKLWAYKSNQSQTQHYAPLLIGTDVTHVHEEPDTDYAGAGYIAITFVGLLVIWLTARFVIYRKREPLKFRVT
jgi:hypothetical protein